MSSSTANRISIACASDFVDLGEIIHLIPKNRNAIFQPLSISQFARDAVQIHINDIVKVAIDPTC